MDRIDTTAEVCDLLIFESGAPVVDVRGSHNAVEAWVRAIAELSGQPVDWHLDIEDGPTFARVLCLGDVAAVQAAVDALEPWLAGSVVRRHVVARVAA
jgi:hypothetical protein